MSARTARRRRADHPPLGPALAAAAVVALLAGSAAAAAVYALPAAAPPRGSAVAWAAGAMGLLLTACAAVTAYALSAARHHRSRRAATDAEAARLAERVLPELVTRLRAGESAQTALAALPTPAHPAYDFMLVTFAREVGRGERTRAALAASCANAAGRLQALTTGMLADLREMEHRHDEEVLGDLLDVDHRTAQAGRLADSIAVLSGARTGRRWTRPIGMESVLRGAMGRISAYQRIRLHSSSTVAIAAHAAEGVMHALAELMDNAAAFSPPSSAVHVYVEEVSTGVVVTVEDGGLAMSEDALARARRAVSVEPLDLTTMSGTRLGLAVVGCLARRHGLHISFRPSARGGTGVVMMIPESIVTQAPEPARPEGGQRSGAASGPAGAAPLQSAVPDSGLPDPGLPQRSLPDPALTQTSLPDPGLPLTPLPDSTLTQSSLPDPSLPQTAPPDAGPPAAAEPASAAGGPAAPAPWSGQAGQGAPEQPPEPFAGAGDPAEDSGWSIPTVTRWPGPGEDSWGRPLPPDGRPLPPPAPQAPPYSGATEPGYNWTAGADSSASADPYSPASADPYSPASADPYSSASADPYSSAGAASGPSAGTDPYSSAGASPEPSVGAGPGVPGGGAGHQPGAADAGRPPESGAGGAPGTGTGPGAAGGPEPAAPFSAHGDGPPADPPAPDPPAPDPPAPDPPAPGPARAPRHDAGQEPEPYRSPYRSEGPEHGYGTPEPGSDDSSPGRRREPPRPPEPGRPTRGARAVDRQRPGDTGSRFGAFHRGVHGVPAEPDDGTDTSQGQERETR